MKTKTIVRVLAIAFLATATSAFVVGKRLEQLPVPKYTPIGAYKAGDGNLEESAWLINETSGAIVWCRPNTSGMNCRSVVLPR